MVLTYRACEAMDCMGRRLQAFLSGRLGKDHGNRNHMHIWHLAPTTQVACSPHNKALLSPPPRHQLAETVHVRLALLHKKYTETCTIKQVAFVMPRTSTATCYSRELVRCSMSKGPGWNSTTAKVKKAHRPQVPEKIARGPSIASNTTK